MKHNRISLDFTSLLDITMIILFFFVVNVQSKANEQINNANDQIAQLEVDKQDFEKEKEEWQKQAEADLKKIREADEKAADNAEALLKFKNGDIINIDFDINDRYQWEMTVSRGEAVLGVISSSDEAYKENKETYIKDEIVRMLNRERFGKDDVIIGVFKYNKKSYGSRFAENIFKEVKEVEYNFTNFYLAKSAYSE